jgi:acyl-coenzyme A synthetase/AMP-(fatty) acid ligase
MTHHSRITSPAEVERLLFYMPNVAEAATTDWARGFAQSVVRQAKRRGWKPSDKQLNIMREMVSDLFANRGADTDGEVFE